MLKRNKKAAETPVKEAVEEAPPAEVQPPAEVEEKTATDAVDASTVAESAQGQEDKEAAVPELEAIQEAEKAEEAEAQEAPTEEASAEGMLSAVVAPEPVMEEEKAEKKAMCQWGGFFC